MSELISIFVNNIAPVLIVAGIGYLVGKKFNIDSQSVGVLIFNVFSPALVFFSLYDSKIGGQELLILLVIVAVFQLTMAALSYGVMKFYGVARLERASVMLSSFCLNAGNYGLSIASFAFGEAVLARAVVVYVGNTALNYTLGVFVASSGHQSARSALLGILRVPAFYATVVAFLLRGFNIELPLVVFRSVSVLKDAAIPAMLILLGLQLSQTIPVFRWKLVSIGLVLKLLIGPILGIGLAVLFQLQGVGAIAFILQTAMPTAVITLVLAKQYQLDEPLSLNLIMASTLLSPFTLSVTILLLRTLWPL